MHLRSLTIAACILAGIGATNSFAQTAPANLDQCRAQAIGQGLSGDARSKAINDCVGTPVAQGASTASSSRFGTCRAEARARGLAGDALGDALDQCMVQSGAPAEASGRATYQDCRTRAIGRGLSGDARHEFVDMCLTD
jgi:hypothetical protein